MTDVDTPLADYLRELALSLDYSACRALTDTCVVSPDLLNAFATSGSNHARQAVAAATRSPDMLWRLARESDFSVPNEVSRNPFAPADVLAFLATSEYFEVRLHVAENPNASPETLDLLADDEYDDMTFSIIRNRSTSDATLLRIHTDTYGDLAEWMRSEIYKQLHHRPQLLATLLGMEDDVETAVTLLRQHPSQVKSILAAL